MALDYRLAVGTKIDGTDIQKQLDALPKKKIVIQPTVSGTKEITTMTDEMGRLVTTTTKFDKSGAQLSTTLNKVTTNVKDTTNGLKEANVQTETLAGKFTTIISKVATFGLATSIIGAFTKSIYEAVESIKEMDASVTELKKVADLSGEGLESYTEQAFDMARELKSTASDVTDAVTEFAKSNYTLEESQTLAKQALIFKTIADGAVSASDSATMLIQVMKAYNMTVAESEHIVNSINEVSNKYALSSSDLSNSIGKVASSAKTAGVDFESLLGLMTAGTEVTQNASKTANGLKSILVNLMSDKLSDQFKEFEIDMRDSNGAMKDGYTILQELAVAYNNMELVADETGESLITTNENMNQLLEDLGGKYNINTLTAILGNFDNAVNATNSAINSANSATDEYAVAMDSIAKKTEGLQGSFQQFVWGEGGLQELIKGFLDASTAILNFANSDVGQAVIKIGTLTAGVLLLNSGLTAIISMSKVSAFLAILSNSAVTATTGISALNVALGTLNINPVVIAMTALVAVMYVAHKTIQKQKELTDELTKSTKSLGDELKVLKSNESPSKEELDRIAYLEKRLELEQKLLDVTNKKLGVTDTTQPVGSGGLTTMQGARADFQAHQSGVENPNSPSIQVQESDISAYTRLREEIDKYNDSSEKGLEILDEKQAQSENYRQSLEEQRDHLEELEESQGYLNGRDQEYLNLLVATVGERKKSIDEMSDYSEILETFGADSEEVSEYTKELNERYSELTSQSSDLVSAMNSVSRAMQEQNETGSLSIDTILSLIDNGYALAIQWDEEGKTATLSADAVKTLTEAKIEQQIADLNILKNNIVDKLKNDGFVAMESAKGFLILAGAKQSANMENLDEANESVERINDLDAQIKALTTTLNNVGNIASGSFSKASTSASKASSETDKLASSVESLLKAQIEDDIDDLKDAEEAEVKVLEDRIDILKKNKDTQLDAIDAQIDGIKALQEAEESQIDSKISDLERQKTAVEDYYDSEIAKLQQANTELDRNNKLVELQEALARAKATQVMVMGENGQFEYRSDESAVAEAEQNLAQYQDELAIEQQIEKLEAMKASAVANIDAQITKWEEYKTRMSENYASQIASLEAYRTSVEQSYTTQIETLEADIETIKAHYEEQIEMLNEYKDHVDEFVDSLSASEQRQLENQLNTIKQTASNYETSLTNLKDYVNKYNSMMGQLGNAGSTVTTSTSIGTKKYTSGTSGVANDEIALVGDSPNTEMVIGSKANGTLMNLAKGTGVVNAESTKTIAGLFNSLGKYGTTNGMTNEVANSSVSNSNANVVIQNVTLPSVTDPQSFIEWAQNYSSNMLQLSFSN